MLAHADRPIEEVVRALAAHGLEAGFLVPTETGLAKSIMDAHGELRGYLKRFGVHDYAAQALGPESKVTVNAWHVGASSLERATASLYRPMTKHGDPRIWVSGLTRHARAGNVLAVVAHDGELYVANVSSPGVLESLTDPESPLGTLARSIDAAEGAPATDLLAKLRDISKSYVTSLRPGDTGVGMTLETLLGIRANSSKLPDYKGIEIKTSRIAVGNARQNRITLFSKTPDWRESAVPNGLSLLDRYGYDRDGRRQLYCSLSNKANSLGLFLAVENDTLNAMHVGTDAPAKVVQWNMQGLRNALGLKHHETFWVKALRRVGVDGREQFRYVSVVHTRAPMLAYLAPLLANGTVELDFLMHLVRNGSRERARDHGYLFKIRPEHRPLLFPPPVRYDLVTGAITSAATLAPPAAP